MNATNALKDFLPWSHTFDQRKTYLPLNLLPLGNVFTVTKIDCSLVLHLNRWTVPVSVQLSCAIFSAEGCLLLCYYRNLTADGFA